MLEWNFCDLPRYDAMDLAQYILKDLDNNETFDINLVSKEFDNDKEFVKSIMGVLKEMEWLSEDGYGRYKITKEGHKNPLDHLKF
jgi:hypothetical protein